jgi:ADP-ribosylglycohydrolase
MKTGDAENRQRWLYQEAPDVDLLKDRISGAVLGVFIGDALGVGVHWQYDLDKLEADRGFVTDYLDPLPGTYHSGTSDAPGRGALRAGQLEQQGAIDQLLLESLVENRGLNQRDFLERFEHVILNDPTMDGTRAGGRYGWTDKSICEIYACRITEQRPWSDCTPPRSDTPDSIVRASLIAALYVRTPREMANQVQIHARAATLDSSVQSHSVAFASMIGATLRGVPLDHRMREFLYLQAGRSLPFSSLLSATDSDPNYGHYTEPDSLLWFGSIAQGMALFKDSIQPAHRGVLLYGQFCAFFASVPSAYYCALRFPENFEDAVLCSVNGGGQNTMRASLTGALLGARVGLSNIPQRFIDGLENSKLLLDLARQLAEIAVDRTSEHDEWFWPSDSDTNFTIGGPGHPIATSNVVQERRSPGAAAIQSRIAPVEVVDVWDSFLVPFFFLIMAVGLVVLPLRLYQSRRNPRAWDQYEAVH